MEAFMCWVPRERSPLTTEKVDGAWNKQSCREMSWKYRNEPGDKSSEYETYAIKQKYTKTLMGEHSHSLKESGVKLKVPQIPKNGVHRGAIL